MKVIITFTFSVITHRKVSLWLWISLENLGDFLSYFVATLYKFALFRLTGQFFFSVIPEELAG